MRTKKKDPYLDDGFKIENVSSPQRDLSLFIASEQAPSVRRPLQVKMAGQHNTSPGESVHERAQTQRNAF